MVNSSPTPATSHRSLTTLPGGHLKPDVYLNLPKHIKKYGVKAAVEVAKFEASQVHAVKELVETENIDCDFVLTRACDATLDEQLAKEIEAAYAELVKSGVADLKDVQFTPRKDAERVRLSPLTYSLFALQSY